VARNLVEQCGWPEIRKNIDVANSCPPSWQLHRRRWDSDRESRWCDGGARIRGTRPCDGGLPASPSNFHRGMHGTVAGFVYGRSYHDEDICVTLSAIQTRRAQIAATTTRIAAASHRRWGQSRWRSNPVQALYHGKWCSVSVTGRFWAWFSLKLIWKHDQHSAAKL
jgi:hypothetical protein